MTSIVIGITGPSWRCCYARSRIWMSAMFSMLVPGRAFFSRGLLAARRAERAICVDPNYTSESDEEVGGRPLLFRREPPPGGATAKLMLLMDVLEHVEDDAALLSDCVGRVTTGGHVFITVPAFGWLWSEHDVFLGHYRRYTIGMVSALVERSGLRIEYCHYYYGFVFPMVVTMRIIKNLISARTGTAKSDMRRFGTVSNAALWAACRCELAFMRHNRLAGLSVVARAVKP